MALHGTKALEKWCKIVTEGYDNVNVLNMSTSWRSGLGFCAIIHHFRPELLDFAALDPDDALGNNTLAFETAEQHLGIPALLDPQDMVECELLDRLSILTYLSQFHQAFHGATQPSAAGKPKRTASSRSSSENSSPAKTNGRPVLAGRRNEPCKICGKAVFILERLNVSGRLLHRTCFKCARCNAQLNVVSYYETEAGEYCCDVCPDEEKSMEKVVKANTEIVKKHLDGKSSSQGSSSEEEEEGDGGGNDTDSRKLKVDNNGLAKDVNLNESSVDLNDNASAITSLPGESKPTDQDEDRSEPGATEGEDKEAASVNDAITDLTNANEAEASNVPYQETPSSDQEEGLQNNVVDVVAPVEPKSTEDEESKNPFGDDDSETEETSNDSEAQNDRDHKEEANEDSLPVAQTVVEGDKEGPEDAPNGSEVEEVSSTKELEEESDDVQKQEDTDVDPPKVAEANEEVPKEVETCEEGSTEVPASEGSSAEVAVCDRESDETHPEVTVTASDDAEPEKEYPDDMNPFGDDDEEEDKVVALPSIDEKKILNDKKNAEVKQSTNPFGSDFEDSDDDDNQSRASTSRPSSAVPPVSSQGTPLKGPPKPPRVVSLNPFGSDFEDDDEEPTSRSPRPPSPSPSTASSIRSRKKRQAPKPPGMSGAATPSPVPSPRSSFRPSPAPRSRMSLTPGRPAPPKPAYSSTTSLGSESGSLKRPPRPPPPSDLPKQRKERDNLNRRSQMMEASCSETSSLVSTTTSSNIVLTPLSPDKASEGQWKKKKGKAPPRPIPQKRQVKKLPRKEVNTELYDIEVKQQGLERQGVKLEKTIRELCERGDRERKEQGLENNDRDSLGPEVEDLIIQLFDLVNEKNDLFRRQTELMYMKRDHRLEEEHADIEHKIRLSMSKPDSQRTDDDKVREEELITRLMEIVSQRNEIVDCLEMDRLRELEEDESFEHHMGEYAAVKPPEDEASLKKKKKKKEKKKKKKDKNYDADKDIDTSEFPGGGSSPKASPKKVSSEKDRAKKFKKKLLSSFATSAKKN